MSEAVTFPPGRKPILRDGQLVGASDGDIWFVEVEKKQADPKIIAHHYSHKTAPNSFCSLDICKGLGVIQLSYGIRPKMKGALASLCVEKNWAEFDRMWLDDRLPKFSESRIIGLLMFFLKQRFPALEYVITYADGSAGNSGTIYRATNATELSSKIVDFYFLPTGERLHPVTLWHRHKTRAWDKMQVLYPGIIRVRGDQVFGTTDPEIIQRFSGCRQRKYIYALTRKAKKKLEEFLNATKESKETRPVSNRERLGQSQLVAPNLPATKESKETRPVSNRERLGQCQLVAPSVGAPIAVDFETFYSKRLKYGLVQMIPEQYCAHELFDAYLVSVCDGTTKWSGHPSTFNWSALDGKTLLSHNSRFDQTVYRELVRRGLAPQLRIPAWHCTANLAAYLCNRRSLQESVEHLFGHRVSKDYRGVAGEKHWPHDYTQEEREQLMEAGREDALWCWKLWDQFSPQWPEIERQLSRITIDQGMRGVRIDREKLSTYIWQTHEMRLNTEKLIPWIADAEEDEWADFDVKPTATKCIAEQCRRTKLPCPPVKSNDEEAYENWEVQYGPANPWIKAVGAWRSINKLYKTFVTIKERLRDDDTLPFSLKYFGAHTGRWSGDARVNMQNQRKRPLVCNELGLLEMDDKKVDRALDAWDESGVKPEWMRYVIDFRSLIIPREGKKMIVSDLSQIEPRVLAWLVGDTEFLQRVAGGDSPYIAHARASMGFTGTKEEIDPEMYKLAKARILGLGYQCGWEKFIAMAWDLARYDVTKDDPEFVDEVQPFTGKITKVSGYGFNSKRIVKEFRDQNPKITALWGSLGDSFKRSLGESFTMELPSGRKMRYEDVRASTKIEKDPKTGKPRRVTVFTADTSGKRFGFYGGKLTENLVQAAARDVFASHLVSMDQKGWSCLFSIHDEAVMEVDPSVSARDVEAEMSVCPDWLKGCPIAAKAQEVSHYLK